ncbi:MAG: bifunctional non-ous end joining protein LigD [Clostridia bacterium]|nr:bifunctional non-ous end joining protein LigD [Clostridia bacterium]
MEPIKNDSPFDDPDYNFQVKWDGIRCLAYIAKPNVILYNRKLHARTLQYPELQVLKEASADNFILDGEIISISDGRPSFPTVMKREQANNPTNVKKLQKEFPISYMVFDILCLNGHSILDAPQEERAEILKPIINNLPSIYAVDTFKGQGITLFNSCKEKNLEGIVAKKRNSPYLIGAKSTFWKKIKAYRQQLCIIGGMAFNKNIVTSLLVGVWNNDNLIFVGSVSSGLNRNIGQELAGIAEKFKIPNCPFKSIPRQNNANYKWVEPQLVVLVEFLEWTEHLRLRHPRIIDFPAIDPSKATLK